MRSTEKVPIDQLQLGSYVLAVSRQSGDVVIKHAGWVRSDAALQQLKDKGVLEVVIDPSKQLPPPPAPPEKTNALAPRHATTPTKPVITFAHEMDKAKLALQATQQHTEYTLQQLARHETVDLQQISSCSQKLLQSCQRNAQALLFLQQLSVQNDVLLHHSLQTASLMAAFVAAKDLIETEAQALTLAALLHDCGKLLLQQQFPKEPAADNAALPFTLNALRAQTDLSATAVQAIAEHLLPRAQQLSLGGQMLAIVNSYANLAQPAKGTAPEPAAIFRSLKADCKTKLDLALLGEFMQCVGLYPPGSVVILKSGRLALVLENQQKQPDKPKVKVFYHSVHHHHIPAKIIDLAKQTDELIVGSADLARYQLDIQHYL